MTPGTSVSYMPAAPLTAISSRAVDIWAAEGCWAKAAGAQAINATANNAARTSPAAGLTIMATLPLQRRNSRALDDTDPVRSTEHHRLRKPDEQTVLNDASNGRKRLGKPPRIGNSLKRGI